MARRVNEGAQERPTTLSRSTKNKNFCRNRFMSGGGWSRGHQHHQREPSILPVVVLYMKSHKTALLQPRIPEAVGTPEDDGTMRLSRCRKNSLQPYGWNMNSRKTNGRGGFQDLPIHLVSASEEKTLQLFKSSADTRICCSDSEASYDWICCSDS